MTIEIKKTYLEALKDLDSLVRETRAAHKAVILEYESALAEWNRAPKNILVGDFDREAEKAQAQARWNNAKNGLQGRVEKIWGAFDGEKKRIRQRMIREIAEAETLQAKDVDLTAIALLNSGVMKSADYAKMADDFSENPAMLALLRQAASKYADSLTDSSDTATANERLEVIGIVNSAKTGGEKAAEAFDAWVTSVI